MFNTPNGLITSYILIEPNITKYYKYQSQTSEEPSQKCIYLFDSDLNFITYKGISANNFSINNTDASYYRIGLLFDSEISNDNKFVMLSPVNNFDNVLLSESYEAYDEIIKIKEMLITETDITDHISNTGFITKNDTITVDTNWKYSDYIDISGYTTIIYKLIGHTVIGSIILYDDGYKLLDAIVSDKNESEIYGELKINNTWHYARFVATSRSTDQYVILQKNNINQKDVSQYTKNIVNLCTNIGFLSPEGKVSSTTDTNWKYSDYISVNCNDELVYTITGHPLVGSILLYDKNKSLTDTIYSNTANEIISGTYIVPDNISYIRIVLYKNDSKVLLNKNIYDTIDSITDYIAGVQSESVESISSDQCIFPTCVYTVCNDIGDKKGRGRNYSASIYLDHIFNGLTHDMCLSFKDAADRLVFNSKIDVIDSNEFNPTVKYNNGNTIDENTKTISIVNENSGKELLNFNIIHRSVLASINPYIPRVLCIGDSITYAEQATIPSDNFSNNYAYHLQCASLFKMDAIDNDESNDGIIFLGTNKKESKMSYNGTEYSITTYHEGYRGWSYNTFYKSGSKFYDEENNKFSINKWLNNYRTMDDNGVRLNLSSGTGSLITENNISNINVCTPTHILIMLGANGGQTIEQYKKMVTDIKSEHPDIIIGLTVSDSAGTYFPHFHNNITTESCIWNDSQGRHSTMFNCMKNIITEFNTDDYENDNVYVLPFYFVQPPVESASFRLINDFSSRFNINNDVNDAIVKYGWYGSVHINGIGHATWAYQLYSWIKYTLAKTL